MARNQNGMQTQTGGLGATGKKGKKGKNVTAGGKYDGDVGAYTAQEDALGFYNHALANEGRTGLNTAPDAWEFLQNQGFNNIYNAYKEAQIGDKNLQFMTYMGNRYGAIPGMTAQNPYAAQVAPATTTVQQEWGDPDGAGVGHLGGKRRRRSRNPYAGNSALGG